MDTDNRTPEQVVNQADVLAALIKTKLEIKKLKKQKNNELIQRLMAVSMEKKNG
jgi:hypothetical protein